MPSVIDLYNSRVASGKIKPDEAQTAVLPEFERLRADLAQPVKRGFFRRSVEAPKGLYLWGASGAANPC